MGLLRFFSLFAVTLVVATANPSVNPKLFGIKNPFADPDLSKCKFMLYTRKNPTVPQALPHEFSSLTNSNFDASHKTFFVIHGWTSDLTFTEQFVDDLLAAEDANVIAVDWELLATWTNYFEAAENSMIV